MDEREGAVNRRTMIARALGATALIAAPYPLRGSRTLARGPRRVSVGGGPLRIPPVLTAADLDLEMREAKVQILPGAKTRMWTYGGTFPGPTIRRPAGQTTRLTFRHRLPASAGEMSAHLHGGHTSSADDGQPGGLTATQPRSLYCDISAGLSPRESGNDVLIPPGGDRTYTYDLVEGGQPERASFQWYHDHRLDHTARNVWRGLAGMFIVDDEFDAGLPLPSGGRDIPLMICDRAFNSGNQLTDPFRNPANPPFDQVTGPRILINGSVLPRHRVKAVRYRLRLLNASNFRAYNLDFGKRVKVTQIGTESGLIPRPLERRRLLIGPGERVEAIVDFRKARGRSVWLRSVGRGPSHDQLGSRTYEGKLMEFAVSGKRVADHTLIPAALRPLPDWASQPLPDPSYTWKMTVGGGIRPRWLINGNTFDPARADVQVPIDSTVTWNIVNKTNVAHLFHIHGTDWLMLERNGTRPAAHERCLKETFFLDPGDRISVAGRITDHLGKFVVHCHMLDHEDHGLMSQYEVVPRS